MTHIDTHVAVWLAFSEKKRLSLAATRLIRRSATLVLSPLVLLEVEILIELGRLTIPSAGALRQRLTTNWEIDVSNAPLIDIVGTASTFAWAKDPVDRLIVANAMVEGAQLITADEHIRAHFKHAVW